MPLSSASDNVHMIVHIKLTYRLLIVEKLCFLGTLKEITNLYWLIFNEILEDFFSKKIFGSWEESEVAGFFVFAHIRMKGYFRLGKG